MYKESGRLFSVLTIYDLLSITSFSATKNALYIHLMGLKHDRCYSVMLDYYFFRKILCQPYLSALELSSFLPSVFSVTKNKENKLLLFWEFHSQAFPSCAIYLFDVIWLFSLHFQEIHKYVLNHLSTVLTISFRNIINKRLSLWKQVSCCTM